MTAFGVFSVCTVPVCGQMRRGAKATCGRCGVVNTIPINTFKNSIGDDDHVALRHAEQKFEKIGWKVGKTEKQNRCPGCFSAIKIAAARKRKEAASMTTTPNKVVPITPNANGPPAIEEHRPMTRDERRIIFSKIDELYVGEQTGYIDGWNDARIATDLGVPRAWVRNLREEYFGPEMNEQALADARMLLAEIRSVGTSAEPIVKQLRELTARAESIEKMLAGFVKQ